MPPERRRIVLTWDHLVDIEPGLRMLEGRAMERHQMIPAFDDDDFEVYADELTFIRHIVSILVHYVGPDAQHAALRNAEAYDLAYQHLKEIYIYGCCEHEPCGHIAETQPQEPGPNVPAHEDWWEL